MPHILGTTFAPDAAGYEVMSLPAPSAGLIGTDRPVWSQAQTIEWGPPPYSTRFRACWDAAALHIRFDARDDSPWHTMTTRDQHIWEEEVVELFVDADGSGRNYAELEISPINVVCDLKVATPWPQLRSLTEWDWDGLETAVTTWTDTAGQRVGWTALGRLPWAGLRSLYGASDGHVPPLRGHSWRFNVFRIKRPGGPTRPDEGVIYAAWSRPSGPSFHDPSAFQPLTFR